MMPDSILRSGEQQIPDQHGNPLGGFRLPAVDVPVATCDALQEILAAAKSDVPFKAQ
jgi:hypothetical protein